MHSQINLSECETWILSILLESDKSMVLSEIMARVKERFQKDWKMQTVCTFLKRMENKGYISRYRIGRYTYYRSEIKLDDFRIFKLDEMKELLLFGNKEDLISYLKANRNVGERK